MVVDSRAVKKSFIKSCMDSILDKSEYMDEKGLKDLYLQLICINLKIVHKTKGKRSKLEKVI